MKHLLFGISIMLFGACELSIDPSDHNTGRITGSSTIPNTVAALKQSVSDFSLSRSIQLYHEDDLQTLGWSNRSGQWCLLV